MLVTLAIILIVLWLLGGFAFHVGGDLVHLLLVIALIVFIVNYLPSWRGRGGA